MLGTQKEKEKNVLGVLVKPQATTALTNSYDWNRLYTAPRTICIIGQVNEPQNLCFDTSWKAITRYGNRLVHGTPSPSNWLPLTLIFHTHFSRAPAFLRCIILQYTPQLPYTQTTTSRISGRSEVSHLSSSFIKRTLIRIETTCVRELTMWRYILPQIYHYNFQHCVV